jgi:hypothetical protein
MWPACRRDKGALGAEFASAVRRGATEIVTMRGVDGVNELEAPSYSRLFRHELEERGMVCGTSWSRAMLA